MMHTSMILDPDACMYDAANFVTDGRTNERTNEQGDSRSLMLDPDTSMYDAYIYVPRSLTLMSDICDVYIFYVCVHDICIYDALHICL